MCICATSKIIENVYSCNYPYISDSSINYVTTLPTEDKILKKVKLLLLLIMYIFKTIISLVGFLFAISPILSQQYYMDAQNPIHLQVASKYSRIEVYTASARNAHSYAVSSAPFYAFLQLHSDEHMKIPLEELGSNRSQEPNAVMSAFPLQIKK